MAAPFGFYFHSEVSPDKKHCYLFFKDRTAARAWLRLNPCPDSFAPELQDTLPGIMDSSAVLCLWGPLAPMKEWCARGGLQIEQITMEGGTIGPESL